MPEVTKAVALVLMLGMPTVVPCRHRLLPVAMLPGRVTPEDLAFLATKLDSRVLQLLLPLTLSNHLPLFTYSLSVLSPRFWNQRNEKRKRKGKNRTALEYGGRGRLL